MRITQLLIELTRLLDAHGNLEVEVSMDGSIERSYPINLPAVIEIDSPKSLIRKKVVL